MTDGYASAELFGELSVKQGFVLVCSQLYAGDLAELGERVSTLGEDENLLLSRHGAR